jgi:hypothetical protein
VIIKLNIEKEELNNDSQTIEKFDVQEEKDYKKDLIIIVPAINKSIQRQPSSDSVNSCLESEQEYCAESVANSPRCA